MTVESDSEDENMFNEEAHRAAAADSDDAQDAPAPYVRARLSHPLLCNAAPLPGSASNLSPIQFILSFSTRPSRVNKALLDDDDDDSA